MMLYFRSMWGESMFLNYCLYFYLTHQDSIALENLWMPLPSTTN